MQTIEQTALRGPLADTAAALFAWGSQWPLPTDAPLPPVWQGYVSAVSRFGGQAATVSGAARVAPVAKLDHRRAIVLFSGGKDSLAAALKLQEEGASCFLLHVAGINGSAYGHEAQAARDVASVAGLPLREIRVALRGKSAHVENPTKNVVLALLGAAAAVKWGAGTVALGLLTDDTHARNIHCGLSDNVAVSLPGFAAIEASVSGLRMVPAPLRNDCESLIRVLSGCPEAVPYLSSCMGGARFKQKLREGNIRQFGVPLLPGRCGSCYKCALEQIFLAAADGQVLDLAWARHCVEKLRRGAQIVTGNQVLPSAEDAFKVFLSDSVAWEAALGAAYKP